jgi:hypothetical protein
MFAFLVAAIVEGIKTLLESLLSLFSEFTLQLSTTAFAVLAVNAAAAFLRSLDSSPASLSMCSGHGGLCRVAR